MGPFRSHNIMFVTLERVQMVGLQILQHAAVDNHLQSKVRQHNKLLFPPLPLSFLKIYSLNCRSDLVDCLYWEKADGTESVWREGLAAAACSRANIYQCCFGY